MARDPGPLRLPKGWKAPSLEARESLRQELQRELPTGHPLDDRPIVVLAQRAGTDDTLVRHLGEPDHLTVVHLNWAGRRETCPEFPSIDFDGTFEEFLAHQRRRKTRAKFAARDRKHRSTGRVNGWMIFTSSPVMGAIILLRSRNGWEFACGAMVTVFGLVVGSWAIDRAERPHR